LKARLSKSRRVVRPSWVQIPPSPNEFIFMFKKIKIWVEINSPKNYSIILIIPITLYIFGFLIWNTYLYSFGFSETEILKAQFITTGFAFFLFSFLLWLVIRVFIIFWLVLKRIIRLFLKSIDKFKITLPYDIKIFLSLCIVLFWMLFYVGYIFPILPQILGGGQPRSVSLISESKMQVLNSLGIELGAGATHQTENLCIIHENERGIYVIREDRILMIERSLFQGFGSLGGERSVHEQHCIQYAIYGCRKGIYFSLMLLPKIQIKNLFAPIFGYDKEYFNIVKSKEL
jgi:hypothetical protein